DDGLDAGGFHVRQRPPPGDAAGVRHPAVADRLTVAGVERHPAAGRPRGGAGPRTTRDAPAASAAATELSSRSPPATWMRHRPRERPDPADRMTDSTTIACAPPPLFPPPRSPPCA